MNRYEEKRAARIEHLKERAAKVEKKATSLYDSAHAMASVIPFGQPILVGHHSERRDRNYRAKFHRKFEKSFDLMKKAAELKQRAASAANNTAISSDDPEAVTKLREKIDAALESQKKMKAANKIIKKKGISTEKVVEGLAALGISHKEALELMKPDFAGRIGFADYRISNNNANIRRMKERLAYLESQRQDETTEIEVNGIRIVENVDENRCQMYFPGKPADAVRTILKSHGFRWSPYNGCWQRQRSNAATHAAKMIAMKQKEDKGA